MGSDERELGFGHIKAADQAVTDTSLEPRGDRTGDIKKASPSTMTFRAMRSDQSHKGSTKALLHSVLTNLKQDQQHG